MKIGHTGKSSSTVQLPGQLSSDQETRHFGVQFDRLFVLQSTGCHKHNIFFVVRINALKATNCYQQ